MSIHQFRASGDHHRTAGEWRARLASCSTPEEVVRTVNEFVASFTHLEIELLDRRETAAPFRSPAEIGAFAYDLAMQPAAGTDTNRSVVYGVFMSFFADASARLAYLGNPRNSSRETA